MLTKSVLATFGNVINRLPTHFVSNICHQHRCNRLISPRYTNFVWSLSRRVQELVPSKIFKLWQILFHPGPCRSWFSKNSLVGVDRGFFGCFGFGTDRSWSVDFCLGVRRWQNLIKDLNERRNGCKNGKEYCIQNGSE